MPIIDVLQSIYTVARTIYGQVQVAKANQAQSQTLSNRIQITVEAIRNLEKVPDSDHYRPGLLALKGCLDRCLVFVQVFSQESWFKQLFRAGTSREHFGELTEELQKTSVQLNLGLVAQQIMNHERDRKDQEEDYQHLCKQQEEILRLNQQANYALEKIHLEQKEQKVILAQQLISLRAYFDVMHAQKQQPTSPSPSLDPHLRVPYYELLFKEKLHESPSGKVYKGRWCEQTVAIRTLEGNLRTDERELFIREINILSRLHNPNIIHLYGACIEAECPCLVMEYLERGSLSASLIRNSLTPDEQKQVVLGIARGLYYLHNRGVLHRDLRLGHILLDAKGEVKLTGFGVSKITATNLQTLPPSSRPRHWQIPECLQRGAAYTSQSDIYSFGSLLYEMMVADQKGSSAKQIDAKENNPRPLQPAECLARLPSGVPAIYRTLITQCWQPEPTARPALTDIIHQLETYQPEIKLSGEDYYQRGIEAEKANKLNDAYQNYRQSAEQNHAKAFTNLGFFSLKGKAGQPLDKAKAAQYFQHAAVQGHVRAMMNLAMMLEQGDGVPQDKAQALHWYEKAEKACDVEAAQKAQVLRSSQRSTTPVSSPVNVVVTAAAAAITTPIQVRQAPN